MTKNGRQQQLSQAVAMASPLYHHKFSRVHFLCFSPYRHCRPSVLHVGRISRSIYVQIATKVPLQVCGVGGFCGSSASRSSPLSCHGAHCRRKVLCKFEEDDNKTISSSSDRPCEIEDGEDDRPPFDINTAVVLAGFAFEAYNTPSDDKRTQDTDPFGCKTKFLSEQFVREVYNGKFWINLKNGSQFPGLDPWGTSDPYVVLRIGECIIQSKTIWATTSPVWNQQFEINVKKPSTQFLQVAAWDANLVTDDRRLGNSGVNLEHLSDGKKHDVKIELEGLGGGGVLTMEIQYKPFEEIDMAQQGWRIPLLSNFLQGNGWDDVLKDTFGSDNLTVRDFLTSVLGSPEQESNNFATELQEGSKEGVSQISTKDNGKVSDSSGKGEDSLSRSAREESVQGPHLALSSVSKDYDDEKAAEVDVIRDLCEQISRKLGVSLDNLGFPAFDKVSWDAVDVVKKVGLESRNKADSHYVESGLAVSPTQETFPLVESESSVPPVEAVQNASSSLLNQTEETLKSWAVLASSLTLQTETEKKTTNTPTVLIKDTTASASEKDNTLVQGSTSSGEKPCSVEELEELRKMFGKAESAMEAWAVLASSLGHRSFVKSAFEKLCFLDNSRTDTQVALWRDAQHHRVVVAFRGTEQVKWKDLRTDLMVLPVSFNPERIGGEFKKEAMVHGGFLNAYDSVRNRLMSLVKASIGISTENTESEQPWQVYVTGHSLGGALATLFALELSTSQLSRNGHIKVTMYNFGSPRVGNKKFADKYNEIVKDSWRVVNHRDIIPTVPRLMGYCHVARPIYLTTGDVQDATVNMELLEDGYQGDVIGEATPDFLIEEFMKGEKNLIEKLLQTEIAMIQSIRDGSALMQHMEDFYYISLLENVSPKLRIMRALGGKNPEKDLK